MLPAVEDVIIDAYREEHIGFAVIFAFVFSGDQVTLFLYAALDLIGDIGAFKR